MDIDHPKVGTGCVAAIEPGPKRRHWARVAKFSRDPGSLLALDSWSIDVAAAESIVAAVCTDFGIPEPRLRFHSGRSPYTGACERPRSSWVDLLGEHEVARREQNGWKSLPLTGAIRLGRVTTMMTLAHELAHHGVFSLDPATTPAHGRVWVLRFDQAAGLVRDASGVGGAWLAPPTDVRQGGFARPTG